MTTIIFVGTLHDDPSGMERLRHTMETLVSQYGTRIKFVAFEWAQATYESLVQKRDELGQQIASDFPQLGQAFCSSFANTLAHEGDLAKNIPQGTQTIWMLNGFELFDINVSGSTRGFLSKKKTNLTQWLHPRISNISGQSSEKLILAATRVYLEESARISQMTELQDELKLSIREGRECYMFDGVRKALREIGATDPIGIVTIGTEHLLDPPTTIYSHCRSAGFAVQRIWPHQ